MNLDRMQGRYEQLRGRFLERWARLTGDDVALYVSQRDQFYGRVRENLGVAIEQAEDHFRSLEELALMQEENAENRTDEAA